jgi:hypothetical protein
MGGMGAQMSLLIAGARCDCTCSSYAKCNVVLPTAMLPLLSTTALPS